MQTYSATNVDLVLEWARKYFEVNALINKVFGGENFKNLLYMPSFENEIEFQSLRYWFWENQYRFVPIWTDRCVSKGHPIDCIGNIDGMEYRKNPFYYYYPDNLFDLAYTIGITSAPDMWDPDKQNLELIININNQFSYIVRHLKSWIGEFTEISN